MRHIAGLAAGQSTLRADLLFALADASGPALRHSAGLPAHLARLAPIATVYLVRGAGLRPTPDRGRVPPTTNMAAADVEHSIQSAEMKW